MRPATFAVLIGACLACSSIARVELSVVSGSKAPAPEFRIASTDVPRALYVERIAASKRYVAPERVWTLMRSAGGAAPTLPISLTYSQIPVGYVASAPAALLTPGQYQLVALVGGRRWVLDFHIQFDGRVEPGLRQIAWVGSPKHDL